MDNFLDISSERRTHPAFFLVTSLAVVTGYIIGQIPLTYMVNRRVGKGLTGSDEASKFFATFDPELVGFSSHMGLALMLCGPIAALIAFALCLRWVHQRDLRSVLTGAPRLRLRHLAVGFTAWFVLAALAELVQYFVYPASYTFSWEPDVWLPLLIVSLLLIPLQTSFEEIFVRGYLLQGIAFWSGSPALSVALTSLLFAGLHMANPEVIEYGLVPMAVYYVSVAVALAVLTIRDNGLEYALGIHAATNIYGAAFVSIEGSVLNTASLIKARDVSAWLMIILFYLMITVFFVLVKRNAQTTRAPQGRNQL